MPQGRTNYVKVKRFKNTFFHRFFFQHSELHFHLFSACHHLFRKVSETFVTYSPFLKAFISLYLPNAKVFLSFLFPSHCLFAYLRHSLTNIKDERWSGQHARPQFWRSEIESRWSRLDIFSVNIIWKERKEAGVGLFPAILSGSFTGKLFFSTKVILPSVVIEPVIVTMITAQ